MLHANNSSCCTRSPVCCQVASCCRACLACLTYQHIPGLVRWTDLNIRTWLCQDLSSVSTMPKLLYQEQISALEAATRLNRLVKKRHITWKLLMCCCSSDIGDWYYAQLLLRWCLSDLWQRDLSMWVWTLTLSCFTPTRVTRAARRTIKKHIEKHIKHQP